MLYACKKKPYKKTIKIKNVKKKIHLKSLRHILKENKKEEK